jgi:hypothetical protein
MMAIGPPARRLVGKSRKQEDRKQETQQAGEPAIRRTGKRDNGQVASGWAGAGVSMYVIE